MDPSFLEGDQGGPQDPGPGLVLGALQSAHVNQHCKGTAHDWRIMVPPGPVNTLSKKKKKSFTSFGQPTRLITCTNQGNTVICIIKHRLSISKQTFFGDKTVSVTHKPQHNTESKRASCWFDIHTPKGRRMTSEHLRDNTPGYCLVAYLKLMLEKFAVQQLQDAGD